MHALSNISDIESFYLRPNWTTTSPLKYYFFSFIHSPASTDLFLVSSAVQRLHLSEFEFYFKFASTFNPTGSFSSTESQKVVRAKKRGQHGRFVSWSSHPKCFIVVFTEKCNISTAKESSTANKTNPRGRYKKLENRPRVSCQKVIIYLKSLFSLNDY